MITPKRHTAEEWLRLWEKIEKNDLREVAYRMGTEPGVLRTWKARGAIPEHRWPEMVTHCGLTFAELYPAARRGRKVEH